MIPYGRQDIDKSDEDAILEVLRSDYLTQGPVVPRFENAVTEYCDASYAVAVNSATSGLHLACLALGLKQGDIVWTSPITFVASANCALYCGAKLEFVDIDPITYTMCPEALRYKLEMAANSGLLPKIVIPVHLCGQSCAMKEIYALSQYYGFKIIEDASHAIGGLYLEKSVGCCEYSDITVFSFHPVKIITTAEGGMALTNNANLAEKMMLLRSHGITRDQAKMTHEPDGAWYYQQIALGFNYRMTEIQAALGISQMKRIDAFVARRRELAKRYSELLIDLPLRLPVQHHDCLSSYHLYVVRLNCFVSKISKKDLFDQLRERGIGVNLHYIPVNMQPYYLGLGFTGLECPEAVQYYKEAISLPLFAAMTDEQQIQVFDALISELKF